MKNNVSIFDKLETKYFIPNDVVSKGHQRMMLWVMSACAANAMEGDFGACTQSYAVGNAMQYKAEHFGQAYVEKGKLNARELTFFKEIFEDWERDYDAPLRDEIEAFKELIAEADETSNTSQV